MEGQVELEDKKEPDVKTKIKESEGYIPTDCYRQARIALEIMKTNQEGKTGYEELFEKIRRKDRENEKQVEAMEEEIEKKTNYSGKKDTRGK